MSVSNATSSYMETVLTRALQTQGRALMNLLSVQKSAVEVNARPLRPISTSSATGVDTYA